LEAALEIRVDGSPAVGDIVQPGFQVGRQLALLGGAKAVGELLNCGWRRRSAR